ncbi:hypothetical protein CF65_00738 [Aggregatibacter actinomycetemcomitans HK1651]|nr:hypothetical protein CF65_00738 [Aggregatibacter actinomycetemcomitans HK1651]
MTYYDGARFPTRAFIFLFFISARQKARAIG